VTARRAKRENGGLGEDPPGSTMTQLTGPWDLGGTGVNWSFICRNPATNVNEIMKEALRLSFKMDLWVSKATMAVAGDFI
jgi:hypothetical protein